MYRRKEERTKTGLEQLIQDLLYHDSVSLRCFKTKKIYVSRPREITSFVNVLVSVIYDLFQHCSSSVQLRVLESTQRVI